MTRDRPRYRAHTSAAAFVRSSDPSPLENSIWRGSNSFGELADARSFHGTENSRAIPAVPPPSSSMEPRKVFPRWRDIFLRVFTSPERVSSPDIVRYIAAAVRGRYRRCDGKNRRENSSTAVTVNNPIDISRGWGWVAECSGGWRREETSGFWKIGWIEIFGGPGTKVFL